MRRNLWWTLSATVGLTVLALWVPQRSPALISAIEPKIRNHERSLDLMTPGKPKQENIASLPVSLPGYEFEPAQRDFLASQLPATPPKPMPAVALPPQAPPPVISPPVTAPQPPAMNLRYMGRMTAPDGRQLVYLAKNDSPLLIAAGDRLDGGYVVESIEDEAVTLVFSPLGTKVIVPTPPASAP